MTRLDDARAHLAKAREFVAAARLNRQSGLLNAAVSDAVVAGVNAKDAICLIALGESRKRATHADAVTEIRRVEGTGADLARVLGRLLSVKSRSQYQVDSVTLRQAELAIRWAAQLCLAAEAIVPD